jgi:hypothetical protein
VASTRYEPHPEGVPVFNIETEEFHTYFVAAHGARAPPVLVHNCTAEAVAPGRSGVLLSDADLLRARIGAAHTSHADEYASILRQLREAGVDIDFRPGNLAYSPARGGPGRIILDPDASMGAVRHEFRHFLDIQDAGFPGFGPYYTNRQAFARLEVRGYLEEIRLARELGHHDLVPQIVQQMRERVQEVLGK